MICVFIDTNIWIRVLSQGKPGCEVEHLENLHAKVLASELTLLLPEIVELELEKAWRDFTEDVTREIGNLEKKIRDATKQLWTEIGDVQASIADLLAEANKRKVDTAAITHTQIQKLFGLPTVIKQSLTADLLFLGKKRLIAGRMPKPVNQAHNDACLVEALKAYFVTARCESLLFCSENLSDFALDTPEGPILHPLIRADFPPTQYFTTLRDMMEFFSSQEPVSDPPEVLVEQALKDQLLQEPEQICCVRDCNQPAWVICPLCFEHYVDALEAMSAEERAAFRKAVAAAIETLPYRVREILKLRSGLGDGHHYTREECAHIFRRSPSEIERIETEAAQSIKGSVDTEILARFFKGESGRG